MSQRRRSRNPLVGHACGVRWLRNPGCGSRGSLRYWVPVGMVPDSDSPSALPVELDVELAADSADAAELDALTAGLRRELLALDVDRVDRVRREEAPEGSKALDAFALGALVVRLVSRPELLRTVASTLQSWIGDRGDRTVKLQLGENVLELTGVSSTQQDRLIDEWIERTRGA
jgi:hypothetical protein